MERAIAFYEGAFGADVKQQSPEWSELTVAGATLGLHGGGDDVERETGLGFDVDDIDAACDAVISAGGRVVKAPERRPDEGITIATVADTEGNLVSVTLAR